MDERIIAVLQELEQIPDHHSKFWNISPETGKFLNTLLRLSKAKIALEIGTSNGYSGIWLAEALSQQNGKLFTIESHAARFKLATENFKKAGLNTFIEQIFEHAPEVFSKPRAAGNLPLDQTNPQIDFVFLDATKMQYAACLEAFLPFIKVGGLIVADNTISHRQELGEFFAKLNTNQILQSVEVPIGSGMTLSYKLKTS